MEPVQGAMGLVFIYRAGTIDRSDIEVAIDIAFLADSRSEAIRLAGKYLRKKFAGKRHYDSNFGAFSRGVGWLWKVRNSQGHEEFEKACGQIRGAAWNTVGGKRIYPGP